MVKKIKMESSEERPEKMNVLSADISIITVKALAHKKFFGRAEERRRSEENTAHIKSLIDKRIDANNN